MNILMVGDVVGSCGINYLTKNLSRIKRENNIDFCVVNGENSADSNGITPQTADEIFLSGADVITTGNHVYKHNAIYDYLDENEYILRPANYPEASPGHGYCIYDTGKNRICVINMMGTLFLEALENPFTKIDKILKEVGPAITLVDFHAEATSEKKAFGYYLDGRVTAVVGTHTHVQTNDAEVLPKGTGYITDLGMTGAKCSVLGIEKEVAISRFITKMPTRFKAADGKAVLSGVVLCINDKNCLTNSILKVE